MAQADGENLKEEIAQTSTVLNDSLEENEWLREMVDDKVETKDEGGGYTVAMKECVCKLLNYNVPTGQVGGVIEAVLTMAGMKATNLTVNRQ